ncbi:MAG: hypothetical protein KF678_05020 [Phycisphaeraceae bacterium]|nr:hypothetical protein [Phycisphaeraceae bacterium]
MSSPEDSFRLDPGTPPLRFQRFLIRLGLLVTVVWGSPFVVFGGLYLLGGGYWILAAVGAVAFAALCHVLGRVVGRFEKDTPVQYGVGCSWSFWIVGLLGAAANGGELPVVLFPYAIIVFLSGYLGARRSVGRRAKLIAEGKCVFCEYDLTGLGGAGVCPECGQKFQRAHAA